MADVKNKPYSPMAYTPNTYSSLTYDSPTYSGAAYAPAGPIKENLIGKINLKDATVGVVGLGQVGLSLAVTFAEAGFRVVGIDTNEAVVEAVNRGRSQVGEMTSEQITDVIVSGKLAASVDYAALEAADSFCICVPNLLVKSTEPDTSSTAHALDRLFPLLGPGKLVVLESTIHPGTTEALIASRVQSELGLNVGVDIFVAAAPTRMDSGNPSWHTKNTPKVVGGITPACTEVVRALYSAALDNVHAVRSAREAEMAAFLENAFQTVNLGLVNELAMMCDRLNLDIWRVIEAASTKPFGYMPFYPGPGIGGHDASIDSNGMSESAETADFHGRFIELAMDVNRNMPRFAVSKLADLLNERACSIKDARVLVLGLADKKNGNDTRKSPGVEICRLLRQKEAAVAYSDPHVGQFTAVLEEQVNSSGVDAGTIAAFDAVVLVTDHDAYDYKVIAESAKLILDCRNAFGARHIEQENIVKL